MQNKVDLYSFDIFDTLLGRRIDPPEYIHKILSEYIAEKLGDSNKDRILSARYDEEEKLRQKAASEGLDYECHYHDILAKMVVNLTGRKDNELISWIREKELELEKAALVVKNGVIEMLEDLKKTGKKIIAISDMYLGQAEINDLLEHLGLLKYFDRIYVSSETKHCKHSGRMFQDVQRELNIDFGKMVHAGDNKISDYQTPLSLGINAIHLKESAESHRRTILEKYAYLGQKQNYWKGRHLLQVAYCHHGACSKPYNDSFYRYGYELLGPIFCTFVHGLIDRIKQKQLERLYFLARDGYLIHKLFHAISPQLAPELYKNVKDYYLCMSRQSTAPATLCNGMDHQKAMLVLYNRKQQGLKSILKSYSLPIEEFTDLAYKHGFKQIDQPISDWQDNRLMSFLNDDEVQKRIKRHGAKHHSLLRRYLEQHDFFSSRKVAFVDIGWNGTIQYFTSQAYADDNDYPEVSGLYFAFCGGTQYQFTPKDTVEGLFYDERRKSPAERVVMNFEEIFEESSKACYATTVGYKENAHGCVDAIFKADDSPDVKTEKVCDPLIRNLQKGILDFVPEYLSAIHLTKYKFQEIKPFMLSLAERAIAFPRKREVEMLTKLVHTEDWGHDNVMDFNAVRSMSFWRNIKFALQSSNWKYGMLTQRVGSLAVILYRILDIRRGI